MIKKYMHSDILKIIFWSWILILILVLWPREVPEPEVIIQKEFVYIYKTIEEIPDTPPEPITEEPEIELRYGFTDDEIYLMTVLLCGSKYTDGDGEYDIDFGNQDDHDQISLVLSVVMNRVMSDKFPNTVSEVIWAPGQFSPMPRWKKGLPEVSEGSYNIVKEWCEKYDLNDLSVMSIPESHLYFNGTGRINVSRERW